MSDQPGKPDVAHHVHGNAVTMARTEVGAVSVCACGVITLTLQYISLRLEPGAFRELQGLLNLAQHRLDGDPALAGAHDARGAGTSSLH